MAERDELVRRVRAARTGDQMIAAVAALDEHDQARTAAIARSRETDMSATAVRATMEPVPLHEHHTAATDWLGEYEAPSDYRTAMITEASKWYRSIPPGLAEDPEEFREQALGRAYTAASAYGDQALAARREFMTYLGYLTHQGASGLPQIQQTVDPHDNPAQTPMPEEPFETFAPPQDALNAGVESPNQQSQISSDGAPMMQQLQQQDGSGSGFGSGPAKPDEHSTSMDTADSYAEVPLGPPGQIPTAPPGAAPSAPSAQNPADGMENMDEGTEHRPNVVSAALTGPDQEGFRWRIASDQDVDTFDVPWHSKCGSWHWPEQACHHGSEHTASLAVGYLMNAEDWSRRARFESLGAQEGEAILRLGSLAKLAAHHDALMGGFRVQARSEDEIAWLHGYLARVRPVLAKGAVPSDDNPALSGSCPGCGGKAGKNGGLCADCLASGSKGRKKKNKRAQGSRLDFPEAPAGVTATAADSVPLRICPQCGSTYCKHWQGRDKPYDLPGEPYGTAGEERTAMRKGAPFAGYADFDACVRANSDKNDPQAYCGKIKHQVEGIRRVAAGDKCACGEDADGTCTACDKPVCDEHCTMKDHDRFCSSCAPQPGRQAAQRRTAQGYSEGYEGWDAEVPSHLRGSFQELWRDDPDSWEHREPTEADRAAFRRHVELHYPEEVSRAYFRHQGASSLTQVQETVDSHDNPNPGADQLNTAVMFPLNPAMGGEGEDRSKEAARRSMRPSNTAIAMFGRLDAMEGKPPPHKDDYVFGRHGHGIYLRAHNETRGAADAIMDREPVSKEKYAEQTGRPDLHQHYLGVYSSVKAGRGGNGDVVQVQGSLHTADTLTRPHQSTDDDNPPFNSAATTPEEPGGDYAQGVRDGQEDAQAGEHPTFADNSSLVTPYVKGYAVGYSGRPPDTGVPDMPRSLGGDSGQAMNDQEAQRAFQVSRASLQRQAAMCYGCPHPAHRTEPCHYEGCRHLHNPGEEGAGPGMHARQIGHVPDPDHPGYSKPPPGRGLGPTEPGDPYKGYQRGQGGGLGSAKPGRPYEGYGREGVRRQAHDFTEEERADAKHSLGPEHKLPVNSEQDLENAHTRAHQVKGIPESQVDAYLTRLDKEFGKSSSEHAHAASLRPVSAAFLTREAVRDPDFRKGYKFAAHWVPGDLLVTQGSPAFEAGMYAAIADRPAAQEAWANEHYRLSRKFPVLGQRLDAHSSFTVKFARARGSRYNISSSGYLVPAGSSRPGKARQVTAGTTVDLITDGPGTSPDPMGSTPLNGPGQPPPMGGGEDPARSGGVPPYQGAQPAGGAPVAPDDVVGMPQEAPQASGPFTQTFSGRQPGNADLAPVAPNTADQPGYENVDAYQGDPMRRQQATAFRQRVQASLQARKSLAS